MSKEVITEEQKAGMEAAFPVLDHNGNDLIMREPGLTKRELFAAMAMQGLAANSVPGSHHVPQNLVTEAVELTDLLLKELAK